MAYQIRHAGSPKLLSGISAQQIADGLRDGRWDAADEVRGEGETSWQALENHPQFAELVEELDELGPPRHEEPTNLDMNALIDVCLVLLIFFILTTTYALAVQKVVEVPEAKAEGKKARQVSAAEIKQRMVRVRAFKDAGGKLTIQIENTTRDVTDAEGKIDKARLAEELRREVKGDTIRTEVLLDARDVSWGEFITIQDAARSAGVDKIHHVSKAK
ncbi:MAG: biopolymer transporter ExbD [Gemmataceae bacterium]